MNFYKRIILSLGTTENIVSSRKENDKDHSKAKRESLGIPKRMASFLGATNDAKEFQYLYWQTKIVHWKSSRKIDLET